MMISLFCCLCLLSFLFAASSCKANNEHGIASSTYNTPAPPPAFTNHNKASLKPGIAIIVGILTTIFSVTFLILLYVKHCKRNNYDYDSNARGPIAAYSARRNSGINRSVIDMLPVFRFGSLRGQKEGLECAVCLNKFDPSEVLRLLPKCKHAFHVECVDTWLDAHSTCPLCRHRVDPEDILLIQDHNQQLQQEERHNNSREERGDEITEEIRRISGRHSSAGERGSRTSTSTSTGGGGYLQVIVEKPAVNSSSRSKYRRSLDSSIRGGVVSLGCFERSRRDGLLLTAGRGEEVSHNNRKSTERRLEHRIVVGGGDGMIQWERWSNVHPSDLLYLKAEMIISDTHRLSSSSSSSSRGVNVINERSVSEITGVSRGGGRGSSNEERKRQEEGFLKRWLAWISSHNSFNNNQSSSPCSVPAVKVNTSRSTTGQQPSISSTP